MDPEPTATIGRNLPKPRGYRKPPTFLKPYERDQLIASIDELRDRAIVSLFCYSGVRLNELRMLDLADVDLAEKTVLVRFAKGGKWRQVGLHPLPEQAIRAYLATRSDADPALFLSKRRQRIARRTLGHLVDKHLAPLGLAKRVTPHCLRHTFGVALMKATRNIRIVQRALGHANIQTTTIYTMVADDELYEAMASL